MGHNSAQAALPQPAGCVAWGHDMRHAQCSPNLACTHAAKLCTGVQKNKLIIIMVGLRYVIVMLFALHFTLFYHHHGEAHVGAASFAVSSGEQRHVLPVP